MLKTKIASILIIGSLFLGGCASKSPVNINDIPQNSNTSVSQESTVQASTPNEAKTSTTEQVPSNTDAQVAKQETNTVSKPTNNVTSAKNTEQKVVVQASKNTTTQPSNNIQSSNYNKPNTTITQNAPTVTNQNGVEYLAAVEDEVLRLCNVERSKAGLSQLVMDGKVREAARFKAQEMLTRNYFDHNSPYSGSPFDLMKSRGIPFGYAGENIQMSEGKDKAVVTAQYLVTNWMNSPGHRANILKPEFKKMGVGVAFSSNGNKAYESQLFTD